MLVHSVNLLSQWINRTCVGSDMVKVVRDYLLAQDTWAMVSCLQNKSSDLTAAATSQYILGWDNFVEGRIPNNFLKAVRPTLSSRRHCLLAEKWC